MSIVFGRPDLTQAEENNVLSVIRSGWIGNGPIAKQFEKEFAAHLGGSSCVAVNSCTMALILALKGLDLGPYKHVATTPLTFAATVNAVLAVGAIPAFFDVKEDGTLDPKKINKYSVHSILPVHYTGTPCDMDGLAALGRPIIEDAAHAFGGTYKGRALGTIGKAAAFSFYPTKNITSGDGGMFVTNDPELADRVRVLANQGQTHNAWNRYGRFKTMNGMIEEPGFKGAMPDLNAAIGLAQLHRWEEIKAKRDKVWRIYEKAFGKRPRGHSRHLFTIQVKRRDKVRERLKKQGIPTGIHYEPLHLEPAYAFLGYHRGDFPMAEKIGRETLSLPVSATMTEDDANRVVNAL